MSTPGCVVCGHLACVCTILTRHRAGCRFRVAATTPVAIECRHGRDVCPDCDACTCGAGVARADFAPALPTPTRARREETTHE